MGERVRVYDGPPKIALGELTAWRAWRIDFKNIALMSFNNNFVWDAGSIKAKNDLYTHQLHARYIVEKNSWGFYSLKSYKDVIEYFDNCFLCLGQINIWGQVLEGEKGYRSEYAEIIDLAVLYFRRYGKLVYSKDNDFLMRLKEKYKVSAELSSIEISKEADSGKYYEVAEKFCRLWL